MIKREYFFSGRFTTDNAGDFSGVYSRISFRKSALKAMRETKADLSRETGIDRSQIIFKVFRRV